MDNTKTKKLVKNTAILTIGKISTQMITFFLLPVYTAVLSTAEYGVVDLLTTLVSFLLPIITLQIEQGSFRFLIDVRNDENKKIKLISTVITQLIIQSLFYIILFAIISPFVNNEYKWFLLTNVIACIFSSCLLQISRGLGNNAIYSKGCFITSFFTIVFNLILLLVFKMGAYGMLTGTLLGHIICCIYICGAIKIHKLYRANEFDKKLLKEILKYSLPLVPNMISWWIVNISDRIIVTFFLGISLNGIYSVSQKFPTIISTIYGIFNLSWTESASININSEDRDDFFNNIFEKVFKIVSCLCLGMIAYMPFVFTILVNEKFNMSYYQIPILLISNIFYNLGSFLGAIYVAQKKTKEIAKATLYAAIINIVVNLILIKFIGIYAASISTLLAYAVIFIYRYFDSKKYVTWKINKKLILLFIVIGIFNICSYYSKKLYLIICSALVITIVSVVINIDILKEIIIFLNKKLKRKK